MARQKDKMEIEFQREQLHTEQMRSTDQDLLRRSFADEERIGGLFAARGLLKFLIE